MTTARVRAQLVGRRSSVLIASNAYWIWLGRTLDAFSRSSRRRHRSFFVFGGCLTWLILIWVVLFFWAMIITLAVTVLLALVTVGALLSLAGWIDQGRLNLMARRHGAP
jgi:hypothetical protein